LRLLERAWVPLVVVAAIIFGGVAVNQLRGAFGSEPVFSATDRDAQALPESSVKRVTYEVFGPADTRGSLSYLDEHSKPQQASFGSLPWVYVVSTTIPAVIASVVAQGDGDSIGCRITVNGEVRVEVSSSEHHAQTSCLVKAA
jgi:hypothetical protein